MGLPERLTGLKEDTQKKILFTDRMIRAYLGAGRTLQAVACFLELDNDQRHYLKAENYWTQLDGAIETL